MGLVAYFYREFIRDTELEDALRAWFAHITGRYSERGPDDPSAADYPSAADDGSDEWQVDDDEPVEWFEVGDDEPIEWFEVGDDEPIVGPYRVQPSVDNGRDVIRPLA